MGKMQRTKGRAFEQKIARELRAIWPDAVVRRASQAERADNPDVFVEGGPPILGRLWLELQDAAQPTPMAKFEQAYRDCEAWLSKRPGAIPRLPVVIWHKLGARMINATMALSTLDEIRGFTGAPRAWTLVTVRLASLLDIMGDSAQDFAKTGVLVLATALEPSDPGNRTRTRHSPNQSDSIAAADCHSGGAE